MNVSRKILGFALAVTLFATQFTAVMAYDDHPTTTPGDGGVLAHNVVDVTVPTALKLAFNPNGYKVNIGYTKVATGATFSGTETYYEWDSTNSVYKIKKIVDTGTNFADAIAAGLYIARTSQDQVVSLNYGIINKSTEKMDVTIDFAVTYPTADLVANGKTIEFVNTALDAKYKETASGVTPTGDGTAALGEAKMYLTAVSADTSGITPIESYVRENTWADATTVYYKYDSSNDKYVLADTDGLFAAATDFDTARGTDDFFKFSQTINPYTRKVELADVNMTKATAGVQVFKDGVNAAHKADATLVYSLDAAKYTLKDGAFIDIDTTQDDLAANLELNTVTGYTAYTFAGYMNTGVDWTKAETKTITISPTYTLTVADGAEKPVTGTQKQVTIERAPSVTTANFAILSAGNPATINVDLGSGTLAATKVAKVIWKETSSGYTEDLMASGGITYANGVITISATIVDFLIARPGDTLEIVFDDDPTTPTSVVVTLTE